MGAAGRGRSKWDRNSERFPLIANEYWHFLSGADSLGFFISSHFICHQEERLEIDEVTAEIRGATVLAVRWFQSLGVPGAFFRGRSQCGTPIPQPEPRSWKIANLNVHRTRSAECECSKDGSCGLSCI